MNRHITSSTESGFSLVEMLVALAVFTLLSLATMNALSATLRGQDKINDVLAHQASLAHAHTLMRSDFMNYTPRPKRDKYGNPQGMTGLHTPPSHLISFVRSGRPNPQGISPHSELQVITYIYENRQLRREISNQENPAPSTTSVPHILLDEITRLDFTISDPSQNDPEQRYIIFDTEFENGQQLTQLFEWISG